MHYTPVTLRFGSGYFFNVLMLGTDYCNKNCAHIHVLERIKARRSGEIAIHVCKMNVFIAKIHIKLRIDNPEIKWLKDKLKMGCVLSSRFCIDSHRLATLIF